MMSSVVVMDLKRLLSYLKVFHLQRNDWTSVAWHIGDIGFVKMLIRVQISKLQGKSNPDIRMQRNRLLLNLPFRAPLFHNINTSEKQQHVTACTFLV